MIGTILELLRVKEFNSNSEAIQIAKGKYELTYDFKKVVRQTKMKWQKRK
jgi:hypothetical protein